MVCFVRRSPATAHRYRYRNRHRYRNNGVERLVRNIDPDTDSDSDSERISAIVLSAGVTLPP